jgi:hypothetical protein
VVGYFSMVQIVARSETGIVSHLQDHSLWYILLQKRTGGINFLCVPSLWCKRISSSVGRRGVSSSTSNFSMVHIAARSQKGAATATPLCDPFLWYLSLPKEEQTVSPICVFLLHGTYRIKCRLPEAKEVSSLPNYVCTSLPEVEQEVSSVYVFRLYGAFRYRKWRCPASMSSLCLWYAAKEVSPSDGQTP